MFHTLATTDFKYILIGLAALVFFCAVLAYYEKADSDEEIVIYDFTYMDDKGNVYVVTAATTVDAFHLLVDDHELTAGYILTHVFLAHSERIN